MSRRLRLALLGAVMLMLYVVAQVTGLREAITQERLRILIDGAGLIGVVAFVALFSVGQLAQLPGIVFVLAARAAWGPVLGFGIAYVGALCAVSVSFCVLRAAAGRGDAPTKPLPAWVSRATERLATRPQLTVAVLRVLLALSPPLNIALAMTSLRPRDHLVGSAVGLLVPIGIWVLLSDVLLDVASKVL